MRNPRARDPNTVVPASFPSHTTVCSAEWMHFSLPLLLLSHLCGPAEGRQLQTHRDSQGSSAPSGLCAPQGKASSKRKLPPWPHHHPTSSFSSVPAHLWGPQGTRDEGQGYATAGGERKGPSLCPAKRLQPTPLQKKLIKLMKTLISSILFE